MWFARFVRVFIVSWCVLGAPRLIAAPSFEVAVSVKPIHSLVAALMEGVQEPQLLIGGRQSPYTWVPDLTQARRLKDLDLLIWVGPELEPGLARLVKDLGPKVEVVELLASESMKILPERSDDSKRDPYFWLDNRNMIILLNDLTRLLESKDPVRAHVYRANRRKIMARLSRIDREYEYGYRGLKAGLGVQYYDTLQYFEQAYALKILDRVSQSPLQPPSAAALLKVRQRISDGEAICLLTEADMPTPNLALLTEGESVNIGELDTLGLELEAGPDLYFQLMERTTDTIKRCLNADMQEAEQARRAAAEAELPEASGIASGRFVLTDHRGRLFTEEDMLGKYQLIYFGYTFCPDVCPNTLQVVSHALDMLGDKADLIQPYFITIDPERDTVEVMGRYVDYFDPRLIGLTGPREMIDRLAARYKVRFEKVVEENRDPDLYLMDHSASLYLMAPDGRFIKKFIYGVTADELAARLRDILP